MPNDTARTPAATIGHVIETVTFRLADGTDPRRFTDDAESASAWIAKRSGFVSRCPSSSDDGLWIEHIEWATMDDARAAAAAIGTAEEMKPFIAGIDGPSVTMHHTRVTVAA